MSDDYLDHVNRTWRTEWPRLIPKQLAMLDGIIGDVVEAGKRCDQLKKALFHGVAPEDALDPDDKLYWTMHGLATRHYVAPSPEECALWNAITGLVGEAAELASSLHATLMNGAPMDSNALDKELGDVRYYYTKLCDLLKTSDEGVRAKNVAKLKARYPDGFVEGGGKR